MAVTTNRIQGEHFNIDADKAVAIQTALADKGINPSKVTLCIDYDWSSNKEHQQWLDTAPVAEVVSWLESIEDEEGAN